MGEERVHQRTSQSRTGLGFYCLGFTLGEGWELPSRTATVVLMGRLIRSTLVALAAALVASFAFTSVAGAQDKDPYVGNEVTTTVPGEVQPESVVLPKTAEKAAKGEVKANKLAFTGSDATSLALIGVFAVVIGGSILLIRRRSAIN